MQCCIWWIRGANGDSCLMIFRRIQPYTVLSPCPDQWAMGYHSGAFCKKMRTNAGRKESPSCAIINSRSVKTVAANEGRGIDGGKKRKAGSGTSQWMCRAACCLLWFIPPIFMTQKAGYLPQNEGMGNIRYPKVLCRCWISRHFCCGCEGTTRPSNAVFSMICTSEVLDFPQFNHIRLT